MLMFSLLELLHVSLCVGVSSGGPAQNAVVRAAAKHSSARQLCLIACHPEHVMMVLKTSIKNE